MRRIFAKLFTRRRTIRFAVLVVVLGLLAPQAWAWYHLRTAKKELAAHHPQDARRSLGLCAKVWGHRVSVRLLSCRAAWQEGDLDGAIAELRAAQRLSDGATPETAFEWALLQASAGNVQEVEQFLQKQADSAPNEVGPIIWESLAVGYLRAYRTIDAMSCLNYWLKRHPENVRALELRGATYIAGKGVIRGAEDYRRVLELDPTRWSTRWRLIDSLLSLGAYEEAATHLEQFAKHTPDDPAVVARLARCYNMLGRAEDALRILEAGLAKNPDDVACLRTRGQLALSDPRGPDASAAEPFLRKAVDLAPEDYQSQNLLFQSLQQQGKVEEAKARLKIAEAIRDRAERIGELSSRKLAEFPLDPALHYEMGKLMLETGRPEIAVGWLQTALHFDPDHKPAHAALARYYETRDKTKADFHRLRAGP